MKNIKILDCTLRDGGYVNNWFFGKDNIKKIISKLNEANIDIIECGFLRDDEVETSSDYSNFKSITDLIDLDKKLFEKDKNYALMVLAEKFDINNLVTRNQNYVNTIRLSFHKKDVRKAIEMSKIILKKGYDLFLQPTATMRYSDDELKELIDICNNEIKPKAIAIVDTFGEMVGDDIIHYTKLFDKYLSKDISLAFHSHNNLQTAYFNAILFIDNVKQNRDIVVDASVYGMGRGAGNLCDELIVDYLNHKFNKNYNLFPILEIVDNILSDIKKKNYWGYSLEYYLSAINHCHPNYCIYFSNKKTLTTYDLAKIIGSISDEKRMEFDKEYALGIYESYNNRNHIAKEDYFKLENNIKNRKIIIIGPGKSILKQKNLIEEYVDKKAEYYSISINMDNLFNTDAIFISNRKRSCEFSNFKNKDYLLTSNVDMKLDNAIVFDYHANLATEIKTSDNSLLMLLNILKKVHVSEVLLAGFDGFSDMQDDNYYDKKIVYMIDKNKIDELNKTLRDYINLYKKELNIKFLTKSKYEESD